MKNHLPGHQALVCTHTDGHNGSGNIHVHIIINSLRKLDIEPQSYTTRSIDCKAGYKHHLTKDYLKYLQQELMNLCQRENLYQVDLLSPAQHKITEAEYWLQKRVSSLFGMPFQRFLPPQFRLKIFKASYLKSIRFM